MNSIAASLITLVFVFGGALLGVYLRAIVPQHHLGADSRDVVKLGMGLVGTMTALVLGLLVASAKSSYDTQSTELTEMSSKVVLLDRMLAHYGPEGNDSRRQLRAAVERALDRIWSAEARDPSHLEPSTTSSESLYVEIQKLSPQNETQRTIQAQASNTAMELGQTRWLMYEQSASSVSYPLLVVLILWLTILFISYGLLAPPSTTVLISLFVSAVSVSGAIFLILEMYTPYAGLIQISSAPLRFALAHLGQ